MMTSFKFPQPSNQIPACFPHVNVYPSEQMSLKLTWTPIHCTHGCKLQIGCNVLIVSCLHLTLLTFTVIMASPSPSPFTTSHPNKSNSCDDPKYKKKQLDNVDTIQVSWATIYLVKFSIENVCCTLHNMWVVKLLWICVCLNIFNPCIWIKNLRGWRQWDVLASPPPLTHCPFIGSSCSNYHGFPFSITLCNVASKHFEFTWQPRIQNKLTVKMALLKCHETTIVFPVHCPGGRGIRWELYGLLSEIPNFNRKYFSKIFLICK